jgi:two-component system sensor histidine kinase PhoQ
MENRKIPDPPGSKAGLKDSPRPFSLRSRLILVATTVLVIALGLVGLALNTANYRGAVSSLQTRMESYVYLVLAAMEVEEDGRMSMEEDFADPRLNQPGSGIYVLVQGREDQWHSASVLGQQLPRLSSVGAGRSVFSEPPSGGGFFIHQYGVGWQMDGGRVESFTVSVLVHSDEIEQQTSAFRLGLWRSLLTAGGILLLAQIMIFFLGFRPLRKVAQDVARIESGQSRRLEGRYPRELEPLARNVNRLLETEQSNQARIRNALDSLAHSLKTPLAVIQAGLPSQSGDSSEAVQNAVDEMKRLIATRLQRAGATARRTLAGPIPVAPQLQRIITSLQKVYSHKMIQPGIKLEPELTFYGEKRDLLELTGNLVDNAFKYGKRRVRVSGGKLGAGATRPGFWMCVEDDGDGVEESQWERLLQRGARGDERVEGHGLGLAIVMELVTAYGGQVSIGHSELGGASITVEIPAS